MFIALFVKILFFLCVIEFDQFEFSVKDYRAKQILMQCDSTGDLYPVTTSISQALVSITPSLWHQHLGHLGHHVFKKTFSQWF